MRRKNFREIKPPTVMIVPMIDIMLFLLVFFMLSTIYISQTNNFQVNLPQTSEAQKNENFKKIIHITVLETGEIIFEEDKVSKNVLVQRAAYEIKNDKDTIFLLQGDKSAKYEKIISVLEILKKSGVKNISIATEIRKSSEK